jgi:hypothetical protein
LVSVCLYHGLAGAELVVGVAAGSNNSPRKVCSALGGRITFDGGGGSVGQTLGFAACPPIAQPEIASTHVSHNNISDGRGRNAVFFMFRSNRGHSAGLVVFDGACALNLRDD